MPCSENEILKWPFSQARTFPLYYHPRDVRDQVETDITHADMDQSFMSYQCERDQCFHACRVLRMNRIPAVPSSVIGRILKIDKGRPNREFK
jgi:hypothetical protein